jgi:hypothetical protein
MQKETCTWAVLRKRFLYLKVNATTCRSANGALTHSANISNYAPYIVSSICINPYQIPLHRQVQKDGVSSKQDSLELGYTQLR